MQKIAILGSSGSGKTTLCLALSRQLDLVAVDLDDLFWNAGWTAVPHEVFVERLRQSLSGEAWVISGNYRQVQPLFLSQADTILFLDYSFATVWCRVVQRTWRRVVHRETCCNGNRESLVRTFSRDSILLWVLKTYWRRRRETLSLLQSDAYRQANKIRHRSPRETREWLSRQVPARAGDGGNLFP